ncbi:MAG: hypothetical protein K6U03_05235, partial [Firmicutes bacterium]|nr:hypothetical protein [Bacillota bacterium]
PLLLPTLAGKGGTGRAALDGGVVLGRVAASINAFQTWNNLDEAAPDAEDAAGILLSLSFLPTGNLTYTAKCQVVEERPSPGAAAGARRLITTLSGGVDYLGHPGGRETRGGLRCSASFAGETEAPDTAAALFVSRVYEAGALAAALEQSACRGVGDSLRLALTWRPQVSFRFFGLSPRLTGEIGASWRRKRPAAEAAADWSEEVGLSARLELALTAADTLCLTGAYTWAEYDDYTLKMEYRRMI